MADPTEFVSLAELKAYLQLDTLKTTFDAMLGVIKASVEQFVKNYCHDSFFHASFTEYYDGNGRSSLIVDRFPITAITEINIDSARSFSSATKLSSTKIISSERNNQRGIIEIDESFTVGVKNVKVVYTAGYATVPADLKMAVLQLCSREFMIYDKKMPGIVSQNVGDKTMTMNTEDIPRNVWMILQAYKRPMV